MGQQCKNQKMSACLVFKGDFNQPQVKEDKKKKRQRKVKNGSSRCLGKEERKRNKDGGEDTWGLRTGGVQQNSWMQSPGDLAS